MRTLIAGALTSAVLCLPSAAWAHDFFLLPERFVASGQGGVRLVATVGSSFPVPENAVPADRIERVVAAGAGNPQVHIAGAGSKALNLHVAGAGAGMLVVGGGAKPREVEYAEDRIPLILGEYRVLPNAAAAVEALPKPRTWKVLSRRFAKTFICVQSCRARSAAERSFGAHLEFVGHRSSADRFRLLAAGKPLANYPVDLVDQAGKRRHLSTDARGELRLPAGVRGTSMLFAAKLEPPVGAARFTLDLTSLTFSRN
ncbi:MAG: DUF4198 domain-containing protein [Sphingomonas sp.]|nr:DUF4198 domain-containing protein [Sphingomonas sp.]